ncbi:hypothetical protein TCON_0925 [Astathelohania contejeani]|uniref:C3H1-type domain-containing protein n=1 Tax=Astathelohania contejeani TaxID=164912 RepID=A0ABQ7I0D0_9MICR|nr:hypothetical protein TCON_0925 [Thelohania contejeani]
MKKLCRYFQEGKCRFGKNCKYEHTTITNVVDPPRWILSCYKDDIVSLETLDISYEEVRARFYDLYSIPNGLETFASEWDGVYKHNYFKICEYINYLCGMGNVCSYTERAVDLRQQNNLGAFLGVYNTNSFMAEFLRLQSSNGVVLPNPKTEGRNEQSRGNKFNDSWRSPNQNKSGNRNVFKNEDHKQDLGYYSRNGYYGRNDKNNNYTRPYDNRSHESKSFENRRYDSKYNYNNAPSIDMPRYGSYNRPHESFNRSCDSIRNNNSHSGFGSIPLSTIPNMGISQPPRTNTTIPQSPKGFHFAPNESDSSMNPEEDYGFGDLPFLPPKT